jgi:hypothetical protein
MGGDSVSFRYLGTFVQCVQDIGDTAVGPGTGYPFEMTLEHAMYLYWKIHTFYISGGYDFTWEYNNTVIDVTVTSAGTVDADIPPVFEDRWPTKMSDMVCTLPFFYGYNQTGTGITTGNSGSATTINFTELQINYYANILKKKTEGQTDLEAKYYIPFVCNIIPYGDYGAIYSTNLDAYGPFTSKEDGFKITIDNTVYKTKMYAYSIFNTGFNLNLDCSFNLVSKNARLAE